MKKLLLLLPLLIVLLSSSAQKSISTNTSQAHVKKPAAAKRQLTYTIINSEQNTFGYDILDGNHALIHQPSIPAMPGNKGFATRKDAEKVAKLVMEKINKRIMPPTVTPQELKHLKIKQ